MLENKLELKNKSIKQKLKVQFLKTIKQEDKK